MARRLKTVSRTFGGVLCHKCLRERIIRAFLIDEQKVVKVLRAQQAASKAAPGQDKAKASTKAGKTDKAPTKAGKTDKKVVDKKAAKAPPAQQKSASKAAPEQAKAKSPTKAGKADKKVDEKKAAEKKVDDKKATEKKADDKKGSAKVPPAPLKSILKAPGQAKAKAPPKAGKTDKKAT